MIELSDGDASLSFDSSVRLGAPGEGAEVTPAFAPAGSIAADPLGLGAGVVHTERATVRTPPGPDLPPRTASSRSSATPGGPTTAGPGWPAGCGCATTARARWRSPS